MKKILSLFPALLMLSTAFSQQDPLIRYIPTDASMVMRFNPVQIAKKIPGETFRQSSLYEEMMKKDDGKLKAFFTDPATSGIDFSKDLLFTSVSDTLSEYPTSTFQLFGVLKNAELLATTAKQLMKRGETIKTYGTNNILLPANAKSAIAWNNEVFVIVMGKKGDNYLSPAVMAVEDTTPIAYDPKKYEQEEKMREELMKKELRNYCFELLTPKNKNPFFKNDIFSGVMMEPGDIKIWGSGKGNGTGMGKYIGLVPPKAINMFSKLQSLMGNNKTTVVNFDNGKITALNRSYVNEEIAGLYKKYPAGPIKADLMKRLPKGTLLGSMNTSFNKEMAVEMMQRTGLNELLDSFKTVLPFDVSTVSAAFKNNMMLAVVKTDKGESQEEENDKAKMKGIELFFAMPIADKSKFEELRASVSKMIDSLKENGKGEKMMKELHPVVKYNDSLLVLTLSEKAAESFLNNPVTGSAPSFLENYAHLPMVMNINMKEILGMFMKPKKGEEERPKDIQAKKMIDLFDQVIMSGGNYENGSVNSSMEFRFSNTNENSLKQLFEMLNMIASEKKHSQKIKLVDIEPVDIKQEEKDATPPPPPPPPPKKPVKKQKN